MIINNPKAIYNDDTLLIQLLLFKTLLRDEIFEVNCIFKTPQKFKDILGSIYNKLIAIDYNIKIVYIKIVKALNNKNIELVVKDY